MSKAEEKKRKWLIIILSIGILICMSVTVWALFFRGPDIVLTPDYAPQESESNAEPIPGDEGEKLDTEEGGGAISVQYNDQVSVSLSEKKAFLEYANPSKSSHSVVLQVVVKGEIILRSGRIEPGNRVKELPLLDGAEDKLMEGVYTDAVFRILAYDPVTGEKSMVNTEAEITVDVKK